MSELFDARMPTPSDDEAERVASPARTSLRLGQVRQALGKTLGLSRFKPAKLLRTLSLGCVRLAVCTMLVSAVLERVKPPCHVDLYPGYVAASFANDGRWDRIYHRTIWLHDGIDKEWDKRASRLTLQQVVGTSFVYHPFYLELLRPIAARYSYLDFQRTWIKVNHASIAATGIAIALMLGYRTFAGQALLSLLVAISSPSIDSINHGQNGLLALALALAAAACWRSRAPLWAGALFLALAWACKPWCAALLGLCFALRGLRAGLITSAAVGVTMGVLPKLVMPAVLMRDYQALTVAMTSASVSGHNNISILSTLERMKYTDWSKHLSEWIPRVAELKLRLTALGLAGAVFALGALLWFWRRPSPRYTSAAFLAFAIMPLGICWTHYFVFAIPLAALCTLDARSPYLLRAVGVSLLLVLLDLTNIVWVTPEMQAVFAVAPPSFPVLQALPMIMVGIGCVAAMALAPREPERERR